MDRQLTDPHPCIYVYNGSEGGRERRIVQALTDKGEQLAMALDNVQGKKEVRSQSSLCGCTWIYMCIGPHQTTTPTTNKKHDTHDARQK